MKTYQGIGASDGIAIAPAYIYLPELPPIERHKVEKIEPVLEKLAAAISTTEADLIELQTQVERDLGSEEAAIFEAHRMFLSDPAFVGRIQEIVANERLNAEAAIEMVMTDICNTFEAMEDEYFRQRAMDVVDVSQRLIRAVLGIPQPSLASLPHACVVLADDLTPSDTARMDREKVLGFCTAKGGKTAHAAILARSLGIPAVVGAGASVFEIGEGCSLILDGETGVIVANPDGKTRKAYEDRGHRLQEQRALVLASAKEPARTTDGHQVEVVANIGSVEEAKQILHYGGEGVGLLRTEFLYLDRTFAPSEDEQVEAYGAIADYLDGGPLIIRTLDVGGDKPLPYLPMEREDNPFLGHRGIRLCLTETEIFKSQLRAILRASLNRNIKVMFPMVARIEEVRAAKIVMSQLCVEMDSQGIEYGQPEIGIMIEIPAAVIIADILAQEVDFFSIGTNDLTQYTMAVDRTNTMVQDIADSLHPCVLRLIADTIRHAHAADIWVGLCGELAGDPIAAPVLLGLGLDEYSMATSSIPYVKQAIRSWGLAEAQQLSQEVLSLEDGYQVREMIERFNAAR